MSNLRYTRGSFLSTLYLTRPGASGKRGRGPRARGRAHVRKTSTPKPVPAVVGEWGGIARLPARHSRAWMPLSRLEALQAKHSRARTPLSRPEAGPHLSETLACMDAIVSPGGLPAETLACTDAIVSPGGVPDETMASMHAFVSPEGRSPSARDVWKVPRRRHLAAGSAGFGVDMRLSGGWDGAAVQQLRRVPREPLEPGAHHGVLERQARPRGQLLGTARQVAVELGQGDPAHLGDLLLVDAQR